MKQLLAILIGAATLLAGSNAWACGTKPSGGGCGGGTHATGDHVMHQAAATETATDSVAAYPIDFCVVSGEKLGGMGEPVKYEYQGRTVMFCCGGCVKKFEAEPAKYLAVLDAAIAASEKPAMQEAVTASNADSTNVTADSAAAKPAAKAVAKLEKLDWCIVSGETLGEMGKPVAYKWKDREMTFCCKSCVKIFEKQPLAYIEKLDSALAGQITQPKKPEAKPAAKDDHSGHTH